MKTNVVVTGVGFLNDWVIGKENISKFLSNPVPQQPLEKVDFDAYIDTSLVRRADHISRCALVAAKLALEDAGLSAFSIEGGKKVGAVIGTVHGPLHYTLDYHSSLVMGDPKLSSPLFFSESVPNAPVSHISTVLGIRGYTTTLSGYCSAMQALKLGAELIEEGGIDICLVGGADVNHDFLIKTYGLCLPNPELIGKIFGGSGFVVLESLDHATQRNARIYALLEGVNIITASYAMAEKYAIYPLKELLTQVGTELKEQEYLLNSSCDEEDSLNRNRMYLQAFQCSRNVILDCSNSFGHGFSAAEAFQIILGILGLYSSKNLASFKAFNSLKKHLDRIFVMHVGSAGANACALFSRCSADRDL